MNMPGQPDATTISAIASPLVAVVAFFVSWKSYRLARRIYKEGPLHREREDAKRVSITLPPRKSSDPTTDSIMIRLSNRGPRIVRNVHVRLLDRHGRIVFHAPQDDLDDDRVRERNEPVKQTVKCQPGSVASALLTFTDVHQRWSVDNAGELQPIRQPLCIRSGLDLSRGLVRFGDDIRNNFGVTISHISPMDREPENSLLPVLLAERRNEAAIRRSIFRDSVRKRRDEPGAGPHVTAIPHDWMGELDAGEPWLERFLSRRDSDLSDPLARKAWELFSDGERTRGIPIAFDTAILLRNQNIEAPRSFEHLLKIGDDYCNRRKDKNARPVALATGGLGNPFMLLNILASGGAELFGRDHEEWIVDPSRLTCDTSIETMRAFQELVAKHPFAFPNKGYQCTQARNLFKKELTPFLIDTAGAFGMWPDHSVPETVQLSGLPPLLDHSQPADGLSIVYGFVIPKGCPDALLAEDLLPYAMSKEEYCKEISRSLRMPVVGENSLVAEGGQAQAILQLCQDAPVMPSHPNMSSVWSSLGQLSHGLIRGDRQVVVETLAETASRALRDAMSSVP